MWYFSLWKIKRRDVSLSVIKIPVFKRKCWFFLTIPPNEEFSGNYINLLQLMRQTHQPSKESLCSQIQKKPCVSLLLSQTGRTESGWGIIRPMDNCQTTRKPLTITLDAHNSLYLHSPSWPSSLSSAPARPQTPVRGRSLPPSNRHTPHR